MAEKWKPILEGYYAVSSHGRIMRLIPCVNSDTHPGKILKATIVQGYPVYSLILKGVRIQKRVHLWVAEAFIGPKPTGLTVNHKDGNKMNNHVENLEYITREANVRHAVENKLMARGEKQGSAKLKDSEAKEIFALLAQKVKGREIAKRYGVSEGIISRIKTGRNWQHMAGVA